MHPNSPKSNHIFFRNDLLNDKNYFHCFDWSGLAKTLPTSFNVLDQTLMEIHETASELRDQGTTYSNQQLNEILVRMPVLLLFYFMFIRSKKFGLYFRGENPTECNKELHAAISSCVTFGTAHILRALNLYQSIIHKLLMAGLFSPVLCENIDRIEWIFRWICNYMGNCISNFIFFHYFNRKREKSKAKY